MRKNVLVAGLAGGVVMFSWLLVSNAVLPYKSNLIHQVIPLSDQLEVHQALEGKITEAGTYSIPYLPREQEAQFPDYLNQPVYSINYEGYTHGGGGSDGILSSFPVVILAILLPPLIAAWMLSQTSPAVLSRYLRRFLFVVLIGVIIVLYDDVLQMSFGPQPKAYLTFLAVNNLIAWTLTGLVIALLVRPQDALN